MDPEIKAINAVSEALSELDDPEMRKRVLRWANEKFGCAPSPMSPMPAAGSAVVANSTGSDKEIPGIAKVSESGFRLTVRDVKARSAIDAGLRLTHIAIRAHEQLTGQRTVSSKHILVPLLKNWRVYDGNFRAALAKHKGIIRNGDELELDFHAQSDADKYIAEVLDSSIEGTWKPGLRPRPKRTLTGDKGENS